MVGAGEVTTLNGDSSVVGAGEVTTLDGDSSVVAAGGDVGVARWIDVVSSDPVWRVHCSVCWTVLVVGAAGRLRGVFGQNRFSDCSDTSPTRLLNASRVIWFPHP